MDTDALPCYAIYTYHSLMKPLQKQGGGILIIKMRLQGKVAIITGGASGIGEAAVKLFVHNGAKVVIADIQDELGCHVAQCAGPGACYFHCDVSREADVAALVDFALEKHGRLDIMFSNAGVPGRQFSSVAESTAEDFQRVMGVNAWGPFLCTKYAARAMIPKGRGCILYTASLSSVLGVKEVPAYSASKHAVLGIMKSAAAELAGHGIRVNCLSPAVVPTPMLLAFVRKMIPSSDGRGQSVGEMQGELKGVRLEADDVANAALFMCSDDARYVSGHNLVIDGGFSASKSFAATSDTTVSLPRIRVPDHQ